MSFAVHTDENDPACISKLQHLLELTVHPDVREHDPVLRKFIINAVHDLGPEWEAAELWRGADDNLYRRLFMVLYQLVKLAEVIEGPPQSQAARDLRSYLAVRVGHPGTL